MNSVHIIGTLGSADVSKRSDGTPHDYGNWYVDVDAWDGYGSNIGVPVRIPPSLWAAWTAVTEAPPWGNLTVSVVGRLARIVWQHGQPSEIGVMADFITVLAPSNWAKKWALHLENVRTDRLRAPQQLETTRQEAARYYQMRIEMQQQRNEALQKLSDTEKLVEAQKAAVRELENQLLYERTINAAFTPST